MRPYEAAEAAGRTQHRGAEACIGGIPMHLGTRGPSEQDDDGSGSDELAQHGGGLLGHPVWENEDTDSHA